MGLLDYDGEPLEWEDIEPLIEYIKTHGILQFLHNYKRVMKRPQDDLKWGDEVEYMIINFDHANRRVRLGIRGEELCNELRQKGENCRGRRHKASWTQEYASYCLESTPATPFTSDISRLHVVEKSMRDRRKQVQQILRPNEQIMTLTGFPRVGCGDFTVPHYPISGPDSNPVSRSLFFPDQGITRHPRFPYLTKNIRKRRGEKVSINIPVYKDSNTPSPFVEKFNDEEADAASKSGHIYMDCMGMGMGVCCLQVTFQARDLDEAKLLYDQLIPVCPVIQAVSAASPIYRGHLSDIDTRWNVIIASVDDRTPQERGDTRPNGPPFDSRHVIRKSRFDAVSSYLSRDSTSYNDVTLEVNSAAKKMLTDAGIDEELANHIAHLWIRDPLSVFSGKIELDDKNETDHFENIQSTNWQSLRFKPPPAHSSIGWRIEFRVLDAQLTDFENAAFVVFVILLTRAILTFKLDFRIPMSKVEENMVRAQHNNAVLDQSFYFRKSVLPPTQQNCSGMKESGERIPTAFEEMSAGEIINGKEGVYPGLIPLVRMFLDSVDVEFEARCRLEDYLNLVSKRASGEYMTMAQWIRHFVRNHPEYKHDSKVSDSVAYDLVIACDRIEKGEGECPHLFGSFDPH